MSSARPADAVELAVLWIDTLILAVLELSYLDLRFDGSLLPLLNWLPFPVSVVLAALTTPILVKRANTLFPNSFWGLSPAVVWLIAVVVIGFFGPGGDIGFLPDWRGVLLLALALLPTAVVVGMNTAKR